MKADPILATSRSAAKMLDMPESEFLRLVEDGALLRSAWRRKRRRDGNNAEKEN